ncbi:hypothetical protein ACFS4T_21800 [Pseudomonas lini]
MLEGPVLSGKRGVNDFIDREAMDTELFQHRDDLSRWNRLLERITADRTMLVCAGRYHRSAWYYDAHEPKQLGQAFSAEYACLKDICRSDHASEALLDYLEKHPELTRPLFYTLPLRLQPEQAAQYTTLFNAGMGVFNNLPHWLGELQKIEQPHLPALDDLPEHTRAVADAAQHSLSPALNLGLSRALEGFDLSGEKNPRPRRTVPAPAQGLVGADPRCGENHRRDLHRRQPGRTRGVANQPQGTAQGARLPEDPDP